MSNQQWTDSEIENALDECIEYPAMAVFGGLGLTDADDALLDFDSVKNLIIQIRNDMQAEIDDLRLKNVYSPCSLVKGKWQRLHIAWPSEPQSC